MLGHQRWPYVGRFARGWHRLPGNIPGQPQTRTRAHPRIGSRTALAQRPPFGQRAGSGERMHLDSAGSSKRLRRSRERRAGRQDVIDEEDAGRGHAHRPERTHHGRPPVDAATPGLRRGVDRASQERGARAIEPAREGDRQGARLVVAALGSAATRERDPGDDVDRWQSLGRRHRRRERGRDVAPPGELQPVHGASRRTRVREGRTRRGQRRWWATIASGHGRGSRRATSLTPRRPEGMQRPCAGSTERPRAVGAPRAGARIERVEHRPHRATVALATDTRSAPGYGNGISIGGSPLSSTTRRCCARSTG